MTKRGAQLTHAKQHSSRENATAMPTKELKKIKLTYLLEKENEHGTNHFFQTLGETPLQEMIELGKI